MPLPEALTFDVYGTLVDPIGISKELEQHVAHDVTVPVAEMWRRKQLEISFRLTAMGQYEDFGWCTRKALDYALDHADQKLEPEVKESLIARYDDLDAFPDAAPALERLREQGYALSVLSNGAPTMLDGILDATGLRKYFDEVISVDEVRVFKPSPRIYHHAAERLERDRIRVRLVSCNSFDVIGAESAGLRAAWINRTSGQFEADGTPPKIVVRSLEELPDALASEPG